MSDIDRKGNKSTYCGFNLLVFPFLRTLFAIFSLSLWGNRRQIRQIVPIDTLQPRHLPRHVPLRPLLALEHATGLVRICDLDHEVLEHLLGHLRRDLCELDDAAREALRELRVRREEVLELPPEDGVGHEPLEHARVLAPVPHGTHRERVLSALEEGRVVLAHARRRRDGVARELLGGEDVGREEAEEAARARDGLEDDDVAVDGVGEVGAGVEGVKERGGW